MPLSSAASRFTATISPLEADLTRLYAVPTKVFSQALTLSVPRLREDFAFHALIPCVFLVFSGEPSDHTAVTSP